LARRIGKTPQALNSKMKRESFTVEELETIARAVDAGFRRAFILQNGDTV
jgi:hypothetical protein